MRLLAGLGCAVEFAAVAEATADVVVLLGVPAAAVAVAGWAGVGSGLRGTA